MTTTSLANEEMSSAVTQPMLEVDALQVWFQQGGLLSRKDDPVRAVDGVSFSVNAGETLALVGESGCGKTTTGRAVAALQRPTGGRILWNGHDITAMSRRRFRRSFRREIQIIFQDPFSSLDPRQSIGSAIEEPLITSSAMTRKERRDEVALLLDRVGLSPQAAKRYPHEFSGGQRQRVGIARALALRPRLIVCDEAVSALDVSIQAQIVRLLEDLQEEFSMAYLFISHDLSLVRNVADRVAVMYLGRIVEIGDAEAIYSEATHPYTLALLSAVASPWARDGQRARIVLKGDIPSPKKPPSGCRFRTRCWLKDRLGSPPECSEIEPELVTSDNSKGAAACHFSHKARDFYSLR